MNDVLKTPKSIKTIITLFNIVKSELFTTLDHAERNLEMFISEQQSSASLQQFIQALQQIRGSLALIEIPGATLVTNLIIENASMIPEELTDDHQWDPTLNVISTSLLTLRHYLENIDNYPSDLSELLLPTINSLRELTKQPALPDSYFIDLRINSPEPPTAPVESFDEALFGRLRQMYQVGLLGFIQDENRKANLRMMVRAIDRLQKSLSNKEAIKLCWVTAAALEAFIDSNMSNTASRKKLFSRVDQQLRKIQINDEPINLDILKDLLYLVTLDNALGVKAFSVFTAFDLTPLPYNYATLESEAKKLAGPNQAVINSFAEAIFEELSQTKLLIDQFLIKTDETQTDLITSLLNVLNHLMKTLSIVGFNSVETLLKSQVEILEKHKYETTLSTDILDNLADVILHVESIILHYESTAFCDNTQPADSKIHEQEDPLNQYLKQGRDLAIKESQAGIIAAQQYIVGYIESKGDKQYLEKMPTILNEIYGCLLFLNQARAAKIVRQCSYYIEHNLQQLNTLPPNKDFDNLADILASLEYFIETEIATPYLMDSKVLDVAEESLATFNLPDIKVPSLDITPKASRTNHTVVDTDEEKTIDTGAHKEAHYTDSVSSSFFEDTPSFMEDPFDLTNNTSELINPSFSDLFENDQTSENAETQATVFDLDVLSTETTELEFTLTSNQSEVDTTPDISAQESSEDIIKSLHETLKEAAQLKETMAEKHVKPSYTGLALEPIAGQKTDTEENKAEGAIPTVSNKKDSDNDDIKFTRPTNWELL